MTKLSKDEKSLEMSEKQSFSEHTPKSSILDDSKNFQSKTNNKLIIKMSTKIWAIGIILFSTLLTSTAQLFYKFGAEKLSFDILSIITNFELITGMVLYAIGGILLILSFRGGEVSVLYPIFATSYIWVSFLSIYFLKEVMNVFKWLGIFIIIIGIVLIGFGSKKIDAGVANAG